MTALPKISIITPSFNQGEFLGETIQSVLSQNYPNLEYWVIDGGSSDNTIEVLKSFGNKIRWISEDDNGQTEAINKGMKRVTGEIVGYLNSDDLLTPRALSIVASYFQLHPETTWLTGEYTIIDKNGQKIQSFIRSYKAFFRTLQIPWLLSILNYINQPSTFWKRSVFKQVGWFDESLQYCMDYDFWHRLMKLSPPALSNQTLSAFRVHSSSKGGSQYINQFTEEHDVLKRYTHNSLLILLHKIHSAATVQSYKLIK